MWGHEYAKIKEEKRRRSLIIGAFGLLALIALGALGLDFWQQRHDRQLRSAAAAGQVEKIRPALQAGADVNAGNRSGQTALHLAIWHGHRSVTRELLSARADVNARTRRSGETPLHTAVRANRPDMALLLLGAGARSSLRTLDETEDVRGNLHPEGVTAREIAERAGFNAVVMALGGTLPPPDSADPDRD